MKAKHLIVTLGVMLCGQAFAAGQMVGGYSPVSVTDADVARAARFAVAAKNALPESKPVRLTTIHRAERQVVAGMNYRMCLGVRNKTKAFRARAVVYKDLSGSMILTEWTPNGC